MIDHLNWLIGASQDFVLTYFAYLIPMMAVLSIRIFVAMKKFWRLQAADGNLSAAVAAVKEPSDPPADPLRFERIRKFTKISWRNPGDRSLFKKILTQREAVLLWRLLRSWVALLSAILVVTLALNGDAVDLDRLYWAGLDFAGWFSLAFFFGILLFAITRLSAFVQDNRALGEPFTGSYAFVVSNFLTADAIFSTLDREILGLPWIVALTSTPFLVHFGLGQLFHPARTHSGRRNLLILRIFDSGKANQLTGALEPIWDFLGSILTITSQDLFSFDHMLYDRNAYKRLVMRTFGPALLVPSAVALMGLQELVSWWGIALAGTLHGMLSAGTFVRGANAMLERTLIRSSDDLESHFARLECDLAARGKLGAFFHRNLNCSGAIWTTVIDRLLADDGAVLMDFRGLTPRNAGIRIELQMVLDRIPLHRVLVLLDRKTSESDFLDLAEKAWSRLAADSPNRNSSDTLKIYFLGSRVTDRAARRIASLLFRDTSP